MHVHCFDYVVADGTASASSHRGAHAHIIMYQMRICSTVDHMICCWKRCHLDPSNLPATCTSKVELAAGIGDNGLEPGTHETKLIIMNKLKRIANTKGVSADSKRWFSGHDAAEETLRVWPYKAFLADMTSVIQNSVPFDISSVDHTMTLNQIYDAYKGGITPFVVMFRDTHLKMVKHSLC